MTIKELEYVLRVFARRRPFLPFEIELVSGYRFRVSHPEAIRRHKDVFVHRGPDRGIRVFVAASVSTVIDPARP